MIKVGYWTNFTAKIRDLNTDFKLIPAELYLPRSFNKTVSIIRFVWNTFDLNEFVSSYSPFLIVYGVLDMTLLAYPKPVKEYKGWNIKELNSENYKMSYERCLEEGLIEKTMEFSVKIKMPETVFLQGLTKEDVYPGFLDERTKSWQVKEGIHYEFSAKERYALYYVKDLGSYSIMIKRSMFLPYKSWFLRCLPKQLKNGEVKWTSIIDVETPRGLFKLSTTGDKTTLIENKYEELAHLADRPMRFNELMAELRLTSALIVPLDEDLEDLKFERKDFDAQDRANMDLTMACRKFAFKNHPWAQKVGKDCILVKVKLNVENDMYFFDDEPRDWIDCLWQQDRCVLGTAYFEDDKLKMKKITELSRPYFHLLIKDLLNDDHDWLFEAIRYNYKDFTEEQLPQLKKENKENMYEDLSDFTMDPDFLLTTRSLLRLLNVINFC